MFKEKAIFYAKDYILIYKISKSFFLMLKKRWGKNFIGKIVLFSDILKQ